MVSYIIIVMRISLNNRPWCLILKLNSLADSESSFNLTLDISNRKKIKRHQTTPERTLLVYLKATTGTLRYPSKVDITILIKNTEVIMRADLSKLAVMEPRCLILVKMYTFKAR